MLRRTLLVVLALAVAHGAAAAPGPTTVRTFHVTHCSVSEAAAAVEPLLSEEGSLTVQPGKSRITIQDRAEVVAAAAEVIARLDTSPDRYRIEIMVLEGTRGGSPPQHPTRVDERMRRMFPFEHYRTIGATIFDGVLGDPAEADLGEGLRVAFLAESLGVSEDTPWGIPRPGSRVHLEWLILTRQTAGNGGALRSAELLRTSMFLSKDQEIFIGAGAAEDSARGLVMIVQAHSVGAD
jgi:hypothetical protein